MSNYKNLLIHEPPLQVIPTLAVKIGLNAAIVLQQLHYWAENPKAEGYTDPNGIKWIFNTYEQWKENFPFWSEHTIQRIFLDLEERGLVVAAQLSKDKYDKRKYYRIDYAKLEASEVPGLDNPIPLDMASDNANLALCIDESETTSQNTSKSMEPKPVYIDYWSTLLEMICNDRTVPPCNKAKIALGRPLSFADGILTVAHPDADWAQSRYAKTFSNWIVALKPGARVMFQAEVAQ
jgi:hypothetical protein